ncbi:DUF6520 family protein [Mucilaginibacter defluvii]
MMVAIVTIMGIGTAFATKAPVNKAANTWAVVQTVGNFYEVTQAAGRCDEEEDPTCKVQSTATPNAQGLIPISSATVMQKGNFTRQ